ncbi:MAG: hypothetical protein K0Q49_2442 [Haloplasmataceae bacterium]|jgi:hypothetical protein|nr:hypothetical protein [Haloplasmataceae bacterium]
MHKSLNYEKALGWLNNTMISINDQTNGAFYPLFIEGTVSLGIAGYFGKYSYDQDCSILSFHQGMGDLDGWKCSLAFVGAGLFIDGLFLIIAEILIALFYLSFT